MTDISSRGHIYQVVSSFYSKIKTHDLLGPIFTQAIPENEWEAHMQKITDFWDSAVFGSMTYRGNPAMTHSNVDKANSFDITQNHFSVWLQNWNRTLDEHGSGPNVEDMKLKARKMASGLYIGMWNNKPEHKKPR